MQRSGASQVAIQIAIRQSNVAPAKFVPDTEHAIARRGIVRARAKIQFERQIPLAAVAQLHLA